MVFILPYSAMGMCDSILNDPHHFSKDYGLKQARQIEAWQSYFRECGVTLTSISNVSMLPERPDLLPLIRDGIPDPYRGL